MFFDIIQVTLRVIACILIISMIVRIPFEPSNEIMLLHVIWAMMLWIIGDIASIFDKRG